MTAGMPFAIAAKANDFGPSGEEVVGIVSLDRRS